MMINSDKLLGNEEQSGNKISGGAFLSKVNRKILSVNLLLKGTLAADKSRKRREEENEKRQNEEDRLEKPSALLNPKIRRRQSRLKVVLLDGSRILLEKYY